MPTAEFTFRKAVPADADILTDIAMRAKAHWGYTQDLLDLWAEDLRISPESCRTNCIWVVEAAGEIAGFGEILLRDDYAILDDLWIDPRFMGQGLGKALFRHLCQIAFEADALRVTLESDPFARPFYEHMGARVVGKIQSSSVPGRSLPLMEIDLPLPENTTI